MHDHSTDLMPQSTFINNCYPERHYMYVSTTASKQCHCGDVATDETGNMMNNDCMNNTMYTETQKTVST